jgi:hypothetical protein
MKNNDLGSFRYNFALSVHPERVDDCILVKSTRRMDQTPPVKFALVTIYSASEQARYLHGSCGALAKKPAVWSSNCRTSPTRPRPFENGPPVSRQIHRQSARTPASTHSVKQPAKLGSNWRMGQHCVKQDPAKECRQTTPIDLKPIGFADSRLIFISECQLNDNNLIGWSLELFFNLTLHESSDVLIVLIISYYVHISSSTISIVYTIFLRT